MNSYLTLVNQSDLRKFSEIETKEKAEISKAGTHIVLTRTVKASSSEDLESSFTKEIDQISRINLSDLNLEVDDISSKWKKVAYAVLPLLPVVIDILIKVPELVEVAQKSGMMLFSEELPEGCVYSGVSAKISNDYIIELSSPLPIDAVILETIAVGRTTDSLEIQWWFRVDERVLGGEFDVISIDSNEEGVLIRFRDKSIATIGKVTESHMQLVSRRYARLFVIDREFYR